MTDPKIQMHHQSPTQLWDQESLGHMRVRRVDPACTPGARWPSWSWRPGAGTRRRRWGTGGHLWTCRTLWRNSTPPSVTPRVIWTQWKRTSLRFITKILTDVFCLIYLSLFGRLNKYWTSTTYVWIICTFIPWTIGNLVTLCIKYRFVCRLSYLIV